MTKQTKIIEYNEVDSFRKDLKQLCKKYKTLEEDLGIAKRNAIELYHAKRIDNQSVFPIPGFCTETVQIYKIKKIACKSLKGRGAKSGIRIIYAFDNDKFKVEFIEIYFKGEKINENQERIKEYLKNR
ncbi:MAG: hypothetical protein A2418_00355 [Candidatus Brennerbacteria bacterium RIFOXYC1_FULL_41_11]|uniref:Addiction module toxin RelE n=1 Tax=Candidatus Brennerbacteria bacterium RIFOXYD1_FULL_41_16 TaxID=1797529 RepID=A0A1G1XK32_9BACT|nr:MAG: hypothetical protein UU61_C0042G0002 [Parcubacteria group bacterium GW2011_GWB1_41_4]OGY39285.1 MAG: hypothetical protein A2391_01815 [Candidatus Brennerbacteria bacterium RIFOXYB1_FULL_41_13]OGY39688.1 MAG: hypothetical protein A2418_00355 [Candidatus Brennerbacteria bacterium RIFOXYC1_FULL_41_11]OGY40312.1 MAG: hypothetical protein A2570_03480 [Candidatus Brennerbacteria bacterium RIFOXYD1_FULL_41_16]